MTTEVRVRHFVVTYRNQPMLERCLDSIFATPATGREVYVINNHRDFALRGDLLARVEILHNVLRPDFSTGHLARNWNQALMLGFESLVDPAAEIVVTCQNDAEFAPGYFNRIVSQHKRLDLLTWGSGDEFVSYTARGVRRVGLWDERFCNIGFQEADYFLRAAKYLGHRCSVNDAAHGRVHNPVSARVLLYNTPGFSRDDPEHMRSLEFHGYSGTVFARKWPGFRPDGWSGTPWPEPAIDSFVLYPYFEKDVETLREQRYVVP